MGDVAGTPAFLSWEQFTGKLFPWPEGSSDRVHDSRGQILNKEKEAFRQILSNK